MAHQVPCGFASSFVLRLMTFTTLCCTRIGAFSLRKATTTTTRLRQRAALTRPFPILRDHYASHPAPSSSSLFMAQNRGLETRREGATPTEGGMTLYLKAGPEGAGQVGDCPFAHYVRMVLEEKGLPYDVQPCTPDTKPNWLVQHYDGKMPALRHRKECYTESQVIAEYLEFFFAKPSLSSSGKASLQAAEDAVEGLFPAIAQYLKHTPDGDDVDLEKKANLEAALAKLETHLQSVRGGDNDDNVPIFLTGPSMSLVDCSLAPKLYHLQVGLEAFKGGKNAIDMETQFPAVAAYTQTVFARDSFQASVYPAEVVQWGWNNARSS